MAAAQAKAQACEACHGPGGNSQNPAYPMLAGQTWRYIYIELKDFKAGRRTDPVMSPLAQNLSPEDMITLGNYFAAQKPLPINFQADGAKVDAGRKVSDAALCHDVPSGRLCRAKRHPARRRAVSAIHQEAAAGFPRQASHQRRGQHDQRYGDGLSDQDIENLSQYIGNLQGDRARPKARVRQSLPA